MSNGKYFKKEILKPCVFLQIVPFVAVEALTHLRRHIGEKESLIDGALRPTMIAGRRQVSAIVAASLKLPTVQESVAGSTGILK